MQLSLVARVMDFMVREPSGSGKLCKQGIGWLSLDRCVGTANVDTQLHIPFMPDHDYRTLGLVLHPWAGLINLSDDVCLQQLPRLFLTHLLVYLNVDLKYWSRYI